MPTVVPMIQRGVQQTLLAATTTGTGTAFAMPVACVNHAITIVGAGTITDGIMVIEEANAPDYSGTWSSIYTVTGTTLSGGAQIAIHVEALIENIRVRLSTNVVGSGGSLAATIKSY